MITLKWTREPTEAIPDCAVETFVRSHLGWVNRNEDVTTYVANSLVVTGFRAAIARGEIPHDKVRLVIDDEVYKFTETGLFEKYPGKREFNLEDLLLCEIISIGLDKYAQRQHNTNINNSTGAKQ
jgi:hypothetical protein